LDASGYRMMRKGGDAGITIPHLPRMIRGMPSLDYPRLD
jgi:hypothetical protein